MLVVLPIHDGDKALAIELLRWMRRLDAQGVGFTCMVVAPDDIDISDVGLEAQLYFGSVECLTYTQGRHKGWPQGPNRSFQTAAKFIQENCQDTPWLWLEPDCVPTRVGWLNLLADAHATMRRPFSGFVVPKGANTVSFEYMAGCGIYPWNLYKYCSSVFLVEKAPFDVFLGPFVLPLVGRMNGLIQHEVTATPESFKTNADVDRRVPIGCALFHKCKDASLIRILDRQRAGKFRRFAKL